MIAPCQITYNTGDVSCSATVHLLVWQACIKAELCTVDKLDSKHNSTMLQLCGSPGTWCHHERF